MKRNVLYLFLTLLLATALAALAQSPTSGNPGGSETKDPYGATLDHPNPVSAPAAPAATGQSSDANKVTETPATAAPTNPPSTDVSGTSTVSTTDTSGKANDATADKSLPRTASDLPMLATIGLLALGGALMVRSVAKPQA
jgi:cobalamin biosynthesis Mg chelatase CobN